MGKNARRSYSHGKKCRLSGGRVTAQRCNLCRTLSEARHGIGTRGNASCDTPAARNRGYGPRSNASEAPPIAKDSLIRGSLRGRGRKKARYGSLLSSRSQSAPRFSAGLARLPRRRFSLLRAASVATARDLVSPNDDRDLNTRAAGFPRPGCARSALSRTVLRF